MSMSKKDFVALAAAIKRVVSRYAPDSSERKVAVKVVNELLPVLHEANSAFKRGTFLDACGIESKEL